MMIRIMIITIIDKDSVKEAVNSFYKVFYCFCYFPVTENIRQNKTKKSWAAP